MAITDINSEDRLVQATFAEHLEQVLGWDSVYAWNKETFGPDGLLGRTDTRDVVLTRDLRAALIGLNSDLPDKAIGETVVNPDGSGSSVAHFTNPGRRRLVQTGRTAFSLMIPCSHRPP